MRIFKNRGDIFFSKTNKEKSTEQKILIIALVVIVIFSVIFLFVVGAKNENIVFIPDQFFLSSLMTGFISGENSIDFRNYDFFASQILKLQGENQLASLMEKSQRNTSLYKITEKDRFSSMKNLVLILNFVLLPILILCFGIFVGCTRFYTGKFYEK